MNIATFRNLFHESVKRQLVLTDDFLDALLAAIWTREHLLFEGPPGTGKTSLAESIGKMMNDHGRVQMTPETLPSDILGFEVLLEKEPLHFEFRKGPIFHELLIVDEINRATPRTQSALLQAMQERFVQLGHQIEPLPEGFLVIATLNPTQMDGTFMLPDSQLDRFGMCLKFHQPEGALLEQALTMMNNASNELASSQVDFKLPIRKKSVIDSEWMRVCSEIQRRLVLDQSEINGVHPLGVRAYKSWLNLAAALSEIKGYDYLTTQCLKELIGPVFMHRFGPFVDADYLEQMLKTFDRATGG